MQHGSHVTTVFSHCKTFLLHRNILEAMPKRVRLDGPATLAWRRDLVSTIGFGTDAAAARDVLGLLGDNYPGQYRECPHALDATIGPPVPI